MSLPLYWPGGAPANVMRVMAPDEINKLTRAYLSDLEEAWKPFAARADALSKGQRSWWQTLFGPRMLDATWLHYYLYQPPSKWPSGLSAEEKRYLMVLRHLRQMDPSLKMVKRPEGPPPSEADVLIILKMLADDTRDLVKKMWVPYNRLISAWGSKVEPLCPAVYGEPCSAGEGKEIIHADTVKMLEIGVFPYSDAFEKTLVAWRAAVRG